MRVPRATFRCGSCVARHARLAARLIGWLAGWLADDLTSGQRTPGTHGTHVLHVLHAEWAWRHYVQAGYTGLGGGGCFTCAGSALLRSDELGLASWHCCARRRRTRAHAARAPGTRVWTMDQHALPCCLIARDRSYGAIGLPNAQAAQLPTGLWPLRTCTGISSDRIHHSTAQRSVRGWTHHTHTHDCTHTHTRPQRQRGY